MVAFVENCPAVSYQDYTLHCGQNFRQPRAKCMRKNTALPCILNKTAVAFSTK